MKFFKTIFEQLKIGWSRKEKIQRLMDRRALLKSLLLGTGVAAINTTTFQSAVAGEKVKRRTPFIKAPDGTRLFYQDWGTGATIVFVAPWALNSSWWEYQIHYLTAQGFRCVAYDRRGHGRSDQPGHGYEFDTLADDLAAVIRQLDLRHIMLVGHSMGCGEVVRYLSRFSADRIARVVLIATITPFTLQTSDNPDGVEWGELENGRLKLSKDRPHQIAVAAAGFFGTEKNPVSDEMMQWWTRMIVDQCSMMAMLDLHRVFTATDFRPDLRKITVPTLLIHGDSDTSTKLDFTSRRSAALIPGSQLKVYEGAAHGLPVTHMEQLNADLLSFAKP